MKIWGRLLVVAGLLVAALPLYGGWEAQRAFGEIDASLEALTGGGLEVQTGFDRGWLRSGAETRIHARQGDDLTVELVVRHRVVHGPLALAELYEGRSPFTLARAIVYTDLDLPGEEAVTIASLRTRLALDGSARSDVTSPGYQSEAPYVRWSGVRGTFFTPSTQLGALTGTLEAPSFELKSADRRVAFEALTVDVDTETSIAGHLPIGSYTCGVGRIAFESEQGRLVVTGLEWAQNGRVDPVADLYESTFSGSLEELVSDDEAYGPGALEMVLRNVDPEAVASMRDAVTQAAQEGRELSPDDLAGLQRLMSRSPRLDLVRMDLASPDGTLSATGGIGIDGEHPHLAMGPLFALMALDVEADFHLPERLLHRLLEAAAEAQLDEAAASAGDRDVSIANLRAEWVQAMLAMGLLEAEASGYRMRIQYREGELLLNGAPFDPQALSSMKTASL
jgi:uncharacterized protein YdgA (DUF945 family)